VDVALDPPPIQVPSSGPSFRERLRQWENDHASTFKISPEPRDKPRKGDVSNTTIRPQAGDFRVEGEEEDGNDLDMTELIFDRGGMVDVGNSRTFLLAGDLVELLYVALSPLLVR
jgi:hypothetical protein